MVQPDVYVENGILHIKDKAAFERIIVENSKKTEEELVFWQDSIGFDCFQVAYNIIFNEYIELLDNKNPIENLENFKTIYSDFVEMTGGTIEGLPDYSIKPRINPIYATVANIDGLVNIGGELINAKEIVRLKSSGYCYKNTSTRRMWVEVINTHYSTGNILAVEVSHQKKILFAWVSYKTKYFWELENPPLGYYYTNGDVPTGYAIYMPWPNGTNYLKMWNRGVGESNTCTFEIPIN
ncbi:MAG: hypothetical protein ACQERU_12730 [Bacteroidota bacterium]